MLVSVSLARSLDFIASVKDETEYFALVPFDIMLAHGLHRLQDFFFGQAALWKFQLGCIHEGRPMRSASRFCTRSASRAKVK